MTGKANAARQGAKEATASTAELEALMQEVLACFFALRAVGQRLNLVTEWGGGTWGLLQTLESGGPVAMAELARRRGVSRQYVQKLAAAPIRGGLMVLAANSTDKRAPLMTLTAAGRRRLAAYRKTIDRALTSIAPQLASGAVTTAAGTLGDFRRLVEARTLASSSVTSPRAA